jgi:hypothetical protein
MAGVKGPGGTDGLGGGADVSGFTRTVRRVGGKAGLNSPEPPREGPLPPGVIRGQREIGNTVAFPNGVKPPAPKGPPVVKVPPMWNADP